MWVNLVDTFKAGYAESDPGVRTQDRVPVCSRCKTTGDHWTMSCPTKATRAQTDNDDDLVDSFFCKEEIQPEDQVGLAETLFVN